MTSDFRLGLFPFIQEREELGQSREVFIATNVSLHFERSMYVMVIYPWFSAHFCPFV